MSSPKHQLNNSTAGAVPYLPLSRDEDLDTGDQSIGQLVGDATRHLSTLVRREVELAKSEIAHEAKKAIKGSIFFVAAGVIALYSSFFLFFFLGEVLDIWLPRWGAFGIVFGLMLVSALLLGLFGLRKFKKIHAPERTINSFKDTAAALKPQREVEDEQFSTRN